MLEFMCSQYLELIELDKKLTEFRLKLMLGAVQGQGSACRCPEHEAETEVILSNVKKQYRGSQWKSKFPPAPEEPDAKVAKMLISTRDIAMKTMVDLHLIILETPVVGCGSDYPINR